MMVTMIGGMHNSARGGMKILNLMVMMMMMMMMMMTMMMMMMMAMKKTRGFCVAVVG